MEFTMHELGLAMNVREIVEGAARENGAATIKEVNIVVGEFSSVAIDALEFAMDVVKRDSMFQDAKINIKSTKTILLCSECGKETIMEDFVFKCGSCGGSSVKIISGDRMYVDSIDIG
ncbi:MAG: hydrogenase maturation nickel metallochaperone HypA [Leptospirales bacterium]|nr:hydrogenase maturation nickel metallochaperone HypA [Leptospirales bacterium]